MTHKVKTTARVELTVEVDNGDQYWWDSTACGTAYTEAADKARRIIRDALGDKVRILSQRVALVFGQAEMEAPPEETP